MVHYLALGENNFSHVAIIHENNMRTMERISCPVCGNKFQIMILKNTKPQNFPLHCSKCKEETIINVQNINISLAASNNYVIRRVWFCTVHGGFLSQLPLLVKGLFPSVFLFALLRILSSAKAKYPEYKSQICARGVFRSQMPRAGENNIISEAQLRKIAGQSSRLRINTFPCFGS